MSDLPERFTVESVTGCNLRCPICATGCGKLERRNRFMTVQQADQIAERLSPMAEQVFVYNWGEPFLNPDIYGIMAAFIPQAATFVHTNGNAKMDHRRLAAMGVNVTVQLDGVTQAVYEQYRVGGRLSKALETLLLLHSIRRRMPWNRAEVGAQFLLFKHNQHELNDFARLMTLLEIPARIKIPHVALNPVLEPTDLEGFKPRGPATPDTIQKCKLVDTDCYILVDGSVVPCCYDYNANVIFGNILDQSMEEIWHGVIRQRFIEELRSTKTPDLCQKFCLNPFAETFDIHVERVIG